MRLALCAAAGLVCLGAVSTAALAAGPLDKAVEARQGYMKLLAYNIGPLGAMAKGEMDYDADAASAAAANLDALSHMNTGTLWPAGSDNGALGDKTAALPAIWETYPAVADKAKALSAATTELAAVAGDGLDSLKAGLGNVGKSCGGCHDDFRQKQ